VTATQNTQSGNHQGVKSDVWVGRSANDCTRVTSLVIRSGTGIVEWGWWLGYQLGPNDGGICPSTTYTTSPRQFLVYRPIGGSTHCHLFAALPAYQARVFSLKDDNADAVWSFGSGGANVGTVALNFDRGELLTNAERHSGTDSAWANFASLQFQVAGSTVWYDFSAILRVEDNDPAQSGFGNYNCHKESATHQYVLRDQPTTCPT
jgi:hypothetical protein